MPCARHRNLISPCAPANSARSLLHAKESSRTTHYGATYHGSAILTVQVLRAKESHAAAAASGRAHTVVQEGAEQTALRDN